MAVASVIVRTYDSAATVVATLESVRAQDVEAEVVVVDSGSTDATLELAAPFADHLVRLDREEFSYGRALNRGAAAATAPVHVALSSHCVLPRTDWLRIAAGHVLDGGAAAVVGLPQDGERRPLDAPFRADHAYVLSHQHWGFSNHASAWSAQVWRRHRFDEELTATEDKEWTWRALEGAGPLVVDPRLVVAGLHRRSAGVRPYYARMVKEISSIQHLRPLPPFGAREALVEWGRTRPRDPFLTGARPFGRTRLVEVLARWRAARVAPPPTGARGGGVSA
ncbi:glycosyltransferase family 2 protein [Kineococcus indalonis]|uniref:glycosyltransferase family 2 protein n=1 Tax=Kineococcus indalonis TaxID=2696566 RepID=UPI001412BDE2|nr:glycosyltransferase family 2 protein [Kineococcus indalonis]NAZ85190.1 glycosyltransferase [Kineococcus indalonis]